VGATIATRRATLAEYGGLLFNRIGSDYNIGKRAAEAGYRVELSSYVLDARTGAESVGEVFRREIRWARTIRFNRGPQYYTILFCYGTIFCPPLLFVSGFVPWAIALVGVAIALRLAQIAVCIYYLKAFGLLKWLWVLPLREMLNPVIWAIGAFGRRVFWRGRWLRVEGDGLISPWEPL
jgi:ceramide glucosyltransferase